MIVSKCPGFLEVRSSMAVTTWHIAWLTIAMHGTVFAAQETYPLSIPAPKDYAAPGVKRHSVLARDGTKLVVHEWAPPQTAAAKSVILFVHGLGMHGEPYASIANGFTSRGLPLFVPDLRGHGRSEGKRGVLALPHVLRSDLGAVVSFINERRPGAAVVLAGESMGGLLAADYAWRGERRLAGLALLAPAFDLLPLQKLPDPADLLTPGIISIDSDKKLGGSTRVPAFIKARRDDPLALHQVSALSYLPVLGALQLEWVVAGAEISLPLYVCVGGKDRIVDSAATKRIFERITTPRTLKTWRRWDEAYHTLCWDPVTPELVEELANWALTIQWERTKRSKE
jgi:alpha-beta hydrolase superfamily lysophospholipase